jgi:Phage terminase small subunit
LAAWDRQKDEGDKAFEAFALYRTMGSARSLRKVAQELGKSDTLVARWSSKNNWTSRAVEWDFEQDRIHQRKHQQTIEEVRER